MIRLKTDHIDRTFWGLLIALAVVAVIALFSASSTLIYQKTIFGAIGAQIVYIALGLGVAYVVQFIPSKWVRALGYPILVGASVLCYLTLIHSLPFVVQHNGAYRWIKIGIEFQPSEISKMALIIVIADQLARIQSEEDKRKYFYRTLWITIGAVFPILLGNLSTAILMALIVLLMWILARIPFKYYASVCGICLMLAAAGFCFVQFRYINRGIREMDGPFGRAITWVSRVNDMVSDTHTDPDAKLDITGKNRQRYLANVAVMRGGVFGVFPGNSKERDFLPLAFADYIFAIIVEETGIVGAIGLIFLYLAILFRACYVSNRYGDYAATLMVVGLALMITCQALISMLVAVGVGPVTGQPLPMITKGGTSAVITCLYFGIILSVSREQAELHNIISDTKKDSSNDVPVIDVDKNQ